VVVVIGVLLAVCGRAFRRLSTIRPSALVNNDDLRNVR
jgi:hypothetical protein